MDSWRESCGGLSLDRLMVKGSLQAQCLGGRRQQRRGSRLVYLWMRHAYITVQIPDVPQEKLPPKCRAHHRRCWYPLPSELHCPPDTPMLQGALPNCPSEEEYRFKQLKNERSEKVSKQHRPSRGAFSGLHSLPKLDCSGEFRNDGGSPVECPR